MNLKKGNLVKVLAGKDKNKSGEIIEITNRLNKAKVKGINMVKKHVKTTKENKYSKIFLPCLRAKPSSQALPIIIAQ